METKKNKQKKHRDQVIQSATYVDNLALKNIDEVNAIMVQDIQKFMLWMLSYSWRLAFIYLFNWMLQALFVYSGIWCCKCLRSFLFSVELKQV